jgi:hypothetical protein
MTRVRRSVPVIGLLELQDDESWFVDLPTMAKWLERLNREYLIPTCGIGGRSGV